MITTRGAAYVFLLYAIHFVWHLLSEGIAFAIDPALVRRTDEGLARG
ncbi:MAG: hypothetical protein NVSMB1_01160 [Polyangiales bacterium]